MNLRDADNVKQCSTSPSDTYFRDRFTKNIEEIFNSCKELIIKKNSDYTKLNQSDPFFNFRQECVDLFLYNTKINDKVDGITLGLITRLNDKRRRRENLLLTSGSLVIDETIADTIKDEVNYLVILLCHLMINGRQLIEKSEPPAQREISWEERELVEKTAQIARLYTEMDIMKKEHQILYQELQVIKDKTLVRRNRRSK